jgi:hypothetical protein
MAPRGSGPGERRGGRAKGTPNKGNVAARIRIEQEADPVGFMIRVANGEPISAAPWDADESKRTEAAEIYPTLDQRMHAHRLLLNKQIPDAKSAPVRVALPPVEKAEDLLPAMAAVVAAMARGEITPDEATAIAGVLESKRKALEMVDLERRLDALEKRSEQK